jgi:1A family penicillin-binding protein
VKRRHFLIVALFIFSAGLAWLALDRWLLVDLPNPAELYTYASAPSTKIFDRHRTLLYEITDPHQGLHTPLSLEEIPQDCINATIATEDASFFQNPGVDAWAIARALYLNWQGGEIVSGGSTITQQLARNLMLSPEERRQVTFTRKLREATLAWRLAQTYSKEEILTLYLNETYYGNLAYGLEAASQAYFGKHAAELDTAECALLAGLPQSPANYNPLEDPEAAKARQAIVLELMTRNNFISPETAANARREKLGFASVPFPIEAPHFVMYIRSELERRYGLEAIYRQGLQVHTTLDLNIQRVARQTARRHLEALTERQDGEPVKDVRNAAVVVLEPHTGEILAMVGSPDYFDPRIDGAVNATLVDRQPGSSIKPITYAAAFDPKIAQTHGYAPLTAATMMADVRTAFVTREGQPYIPKNYDQKWRGPVLLRPSLAGSYNLIAVKVLEYVGLEALTSLSRAMGITTFDNKTFGLALTLGGGEVRLLELSGAYAAFANGGRRIEPVGISQITDHSGRVLYQLPDSLNPGPRVMDERTAYLISNILSDGYARRATFGAGGPLSLDRPAAAKTGTTQDWRDNWTVGYSPDMVVGVWVGNADNEPMRHVSGVTGAAPIWHDVMEELLGSRPPQPFTRPAGLVSREVCATNGLLPAEETETHTSSSTTLERADLEKIVRCSHTITELFLEGTTPRQVDNWYISVALDRRNGLRAGSGCKLDFVRYQTFTRYPAETEGWARRQGVPEVPDIFSPLCPDSSPTSPAGATPVALNPSGQAEPPLPENDPAAGLVFIRPDQGTVFRLVPNIPVDKQQIPVIVRPVNGVIPRQVQLRVNGQVLADGTETLWQMSPGTYTFEASGTDSNGNPISAPVVTIEVLGFTSN